jgi:hypothetical protein
LHNPSPVPHALQAAALYSLAVELRDRLRYSSRRVARLKEELSKTQVRVRTCGTEKQ